MKFRNFLFSFAVGVATLIFGLAWVGVYQFFLGQSNPPKQEVIEVQETEAVNFDINNPESVLPLDFEEDKLTSPHVDETNEAEFDPEGYYFFDGSLEGFEEFQYIKINNKNFDVKPNDKRYGDLVSPNGFVILQNGKDADYIDFSKINIGNGKIQFETETAKGSSYEFTGEFLVKGNFYTLDENTEVLEGTLVKKRNGEVIAKSNINLKWSLEIGCLH